MAQIIKLQDYISRYQQDLKRYSTQYVRLKVVQWERMKEEWEKGDVPEQWVHEDSEEVVTKIPWWKRFIRKSSTESLDLGETEEAEDEDVIVEEEDQSENQFTFEPNLTFRPSSVLELKRIYIDQLFHFQLQWASSTLMQKSHMDGKYKRDIFLRNLTQRLPDNYLLLYKPILQVKKAPLEMDIILLSPTETLCITLVEAESMAAFIATDDRFWTRKWKDQQSKILNPIIGLNRMETVLQQIYRNDEIDLPIRKIIVSRTGYIDFPGAPYGFQIVDKRTYEAWFTQLKKMPIPLKHMQIKAAQSILRLAQTTSYHRVKWEVDLEDDQK